MDNSEPEFSPRIHNETNIIIFNETELIEDGLQRLQERIFVETYSAVCLAALLANLLLIFTVLKFPRLRKTLANQTLLYVNMVEALFLFTSPVTMRLYVDFNIRVNVDWKLLCIINDVDVTYNHFVITLLIILMCDWYAKTYREEQYYKFQNLYKVLILTTAVTGIFLTSVMLTMCLKRGYNTSIYVIVALEVLFLNLFTAGMNLFHQVKCYKDPLYRKRDKLGLVIVNIFIFSWLPSMFMIFLTFFGIWSYDAFLICVNIGTLSPILNCIYLFVYNNDFNILFKAVLTCRCNRYVNSDLDEIPVIVYNDATGVQIAPDP